MQLGIENDVLKELFIALSVGISFTVSMKRTTTWRGHEACSINFQASNGLLDLWKKFPSYYSLHQHRRKKHGAKQRKPSNTVADLNKTVEEEGEDGEKLKDLSACQHFLVDTEMEIGRHTVSNFQMSNLDTKVINKKLD